MGVARSRAAGVCVGVVSTVFSVRGVGIAWVWLVKRVVFAGLVIAPCAVGEEESVKWEPRTCHIESEGLMMLEGSSGLVEGQNELVTEAARVKCHRIIVS